MNLLISSLPEFVLRAKRFKFHEHIELMIKEITQEFVLWSHLGKVLNFSEKKDHILCFKAIVGPIQVLSTPKKEWCYGKPRYICFTFIKTEVECKLV